MKIFLLGATGRTGNLVLKAALENGYEVHVLTRSDRKLKQQNGLEVWVGDPQNPLDLEKAMKGCDAVVNALNVSRKSDFPWSGLRAPKTLISDVMGKVISIAEDKDIKRIVSCSAWGVAETREDIPGWFKWFIDHSNIGVAYRDHDRQERLLEQSSMDWTIIRPVGLTNSSKEEIIRKTKDNIPKPNLTISRKSVAKFMILCLREPSTIRQKITISKA